MGLGVEMYRDELVRAWRAAGITENDVKSYLEFFDIAYESGVKAEREKYTALLRQALEALESALSNHGVMLMTMPPQDAWQANGVGPKVSSAITALRARLEGEK